MAKLFNRAKMDTTTTGSGTITLGSAVDGYQTFADAGVADSDVVQYVIEDGTSWEIGTGTYSASGTSLTRTPSESSNSGSAISLTGAAEVFISAIHSDFERLQNDGTTKVEATSTGATVTGDIAVTGTVDGVDIAARDAVLTSTTTTADAALPKAGGTVTGSTTFSHSSGITIGEADVFHQTANTWRGITVKNNGDSNEVAIDGQSSDGTQRLSIYGETSSQGFLNPTDNTWKLKIPNSGNFLRDATYTIWDSGNDGSGSGLDADTVDGIQGSSFLRSDANDTASGIITLSSTARDTLNFSGNSTDDNRGIAFNGRIALSSDYNDGWLRLNSAAEFSNGIYTPQNFRADGWVEVGSGIRHQGDLDTNVTFGTDTVTIQAGGSSEVTVNTTGVRLGDTGNGYFRPVSGDFGSIEIDGGSHTGWEGYSIGGRVVLMHDNGSIAGLYNDVDNEWLFRTDLNGGTILYNNGTAKVTINPTYMEMAQHLDMNNYDIYGVDQIFHHGDTNTYMQFHAADQWRVVTGGAERLEVNNSTITSTEPIYAPSFHGSGASLTGDVGPSTAGAVGTYAFLSRASNVTSGSTYAGSGLRFAGIVANHYDDADTAASMTHGTTRSGTWRAMGTVSGVVSDHPYSSTLYKRIS
jgi:hypothetical protein